MRPVLVLAFFFLAVLMPAAHADGRQSPDDVYARTVADFVLPGFARLTVAAKSHETAWSLYCQTPSAEGFAELRETFHSLADAWAEIEMIRSGPSAEDFRHERFYFWPERKNAVERGLSALLGRPDAATLDASGIRKESAAVQGLPALERLLQADVAPGKGAEGELRCRVGRAIAANAASLASEMEAGWLSRLPAATPETRAMLATDLVTFYHVIKDLKIEAVIGKEAGHGKPRAAEFWRSGRPLRNIQHNLSALERLNGILFGAGSSEAALAAATATAADVSRSLPPDLAALAAGPQRYKAILLRDAVDSAKDLAVTEIPAALGVTIGFNSLDGD